MSGISSKAAGGIEIKKKYNGIEFENDLDLNTYDAYYRELDPQTGRWWQIDPKIESMEAWSSYASNYDNPITYSDPLGDKPNEDGGCCREVLQKTFDGAVRVARTFNTYFNPIASVVEVVTGKSTESDFTVAKARELSGVEAAISLIPGAKVEVGLAKIAERALISLDNNALIHAIEGGGKEAVKKAIGSDQPIVSITAAKEFLAKGDKSELKSFMTEIGATISKNGASTSNVQNLQKAAEFMGRKLGKKDASIIAGAINNNASILTMDKQMSNFLKAVGFPVKTF